jgi:SAM-dependent methyltransferase
MSSPNAKASYSLWDRLLIRFHQRASHNHRIGRLLEALAPRIPEGARILDLGCGDMKLLAGLAASRRLGRCVGADIWAPRVAPPAGCEYTQIYPGRPLPWTGREFDVVLLIDTLHHADDPGHLLREAFAAGATVLVKDHLEYGTWSRTLLRLMDYVGNYGYGVSVPRRYFTQRTFTDLVARTAPERRCRMDIGLDLYRHLPVVRTVLSPKLHFIAELT